MRDLDMKLAMKKASARQAWLGSGIATLVMGAVMLLVFFTKVLFVASVPQFILRAPLPPEMLFSSTSHFLGVPWVFNLIHSLPGWIGLNAEYYLAALVFVVFLVAWWWLGHFYGSLSSSLTRWGADAIYILFSILSTGLILLPLQGLGIFGLSPDTFGYALADIILWSALFGLIFAATLHLVYHQSKNNRQKQAEYDPERRESLHTMGVGLAILGAVSIFGRAVLSTVAYAQEAGRTLVERIRGIVPEITPVPEHYLVDKNIFNPSVPAEGWELKITGMVDTPITLTLADLMDMESVERTSTLMCVSYRIGGDLIGNSVWTGVRLEDILAKAGVQPGATELILRAADNYSDSFALEDAMREGTIVAYLQNGEMLTRDHGFPARVLVPGIYGMKNVKWVTQIELTDQEYLGFWQHRGWADIAPVKTMSRIDTPEATQLEDGSWGIGGISYAGIRGIQKVEVSVDGGESWQEAQLNPALNDLSWNLWGFTWDAEPGRYDVWVRATDGTGETQTATRTPPLPNGATGYHILSVRVG